MRVGNGHVGLPGCDRVLEDTEEGELVGDIVRKSFRKEVNRGNSVPASSGEDSGDTFPLSELGIGALLERVTETENTKECGAFGELRLVISGSLEAVGSVPTRRDLTE